jgi:deoxyribodipyrimidine photolyase-related protein
MNCTLIFPNNLFEDKRFINKESKIFVFQDPLFFNDEKYPVKFNKKKILMHLLSTEKYHLDLVDSGYDSELIKFYELNGENYIKNFIEKYNIKSINLFEIIDFELKKRFVNQAKNSNVDLIWTENPMFMLTKNEVKQEFSEKKRFLMANFYKKQRKKFNILIENDAPVGGKWSFDDENRKKFDPSIKIPQPIKHKYDDKLLKKNKLLVNKYFNHNYGNVDDFNFPIDSGQAHKSLDDFIFNKINLFGDYEDSISKEKKYIFHSLISQYVNIGLITPNKIIEKVLKSNDKKPIKLNSLEGFIRQMIGWREFIRGIYQHRGTQQRNSNFWKFNNELPSCFYDGTTGILPVDNVIKNGINDSYSHHIERLMIMGNIMMLLEIDPNHVYKWFMEIYIDSYDWVMVPNIYGMSQFSDNGLMASKPYISSSKYILKMSDYKKGDWCEIWDALYWRFIKKYENFFRSNPRLSLMINIYEKKSDEIKKNYEKISDDYILSIYE